MLGVQIDTPALENYESSIKVHKSYDSYIHTTGMHGFQKSFHQNQHLFLLQF